MPLYSQNQQTFTHVARKQYFGGRREGTCRPYGEATKTYYYEISTPLKQCKTRKNRVYIFGVVANSPTKNIIILSGDLSRKRIQQTHNI